LRTKRALAEAVTAIERAAPPLDPLGATRLGWYLRLRRGRSHQEEPQAEDGGEMHRVWARQRWIEKES
jgi:hypothetical protein